MGVTSLSNMISRLYCFSPLQNPLPVNHCRCRPFTFCWELGRSVAHCIQRLSVAEHLAIIPFSQNGANRLRLASSSGDGQAVSHCAFGALTDLPLLDQREAPAFKNSVKLKKKITRQRQKLHKSDIKSGDARVVFYCCSHMQSLS